MHCGSIRGEGRGFTTEGAEDTEGLRVISPAPRFARQDRDGVVGGRAPILPMPAIRDGERVVDTARPLGSPRVLRSTVGGGALWWIFPDQGIVTSAVMLVNPAELKVRV